MESPVAVMTGALEWLGAEEEEEEEVARGEGKGGGTPTAVAGLDEENQECSV